MGLIHDDIVVDSDAKCVIDVESKKIECSSPKNSLVQYDHNSERIGFTMPRYVDGHDMGICDRVAIKYLNVRNADMYIVDDLAITEDGENITFSWLVSGNATEEVGSLVFLINFRCYDDRGRITYNWSTKPCSIFSILEGVRSMDSNPAELYDFWARYNGLVNDVSQTVDKIEETVGELEKTVPILDETVEGLNKDVPILDKSVEELNREVPVLESKVAALNRTLADDPIQIINKTISDIATYDYQFLDYDKREVGYYSVSVNTLVTNSDNVDFYRLPVIENLVAGTYHGIKASSNFTVIQNREDGSYHKISEYGSDGVYIIPFDFDLYYSNTIDGAPHMFSTSENPKLYVYGPYNAKVFSTDMDEFKSLSVDMTNYKEQLILYENLVEEIVLGKFTTILNNKIAFEDNNSYSYAKVRIPESRTISVNSTLFSNNFSRITTSDGTIVAGKINDFKMDGLYVYTNLPEDAAYIYFSYGSKNTNMVALDTTDSILGYSIEDYPIGEIGSLEMPKLKGVPRVFYCGPDRNYTRLVDAIAEAVRYDDSTLYVDSGLYNIKSELEAIYGDDYFTNYSYDNDGMGPVVLKNRIRIVFASNSKVMFDYADGTNEDVMKYFSPFNAGDKGFTIENATIETYNCRYSVHDEYNGDEIPYANKYINCTITHDSSMNDVWGPHQAIGGGLGASGSVEITGCYISTKGYTYAASYHNSNRNNATDYKSRITVKDCYFDEGTFYISNYGDGLKKSQAYVCGNSFPSEPTYNYSDNNGKDNAEIITWNNFIRG